MENSLIENGEGNAALAATIIKTQSTAEWGRGGALHLLLLKFKTKVQTGIKAPKSYRNAERLGVGPDTTWTGPHCRSMGGAVYSSTLLENVECGKCERMRPRVAVMRRKNCNHLKCLSSRCESYSGEQVE